MVTRNMFKLISQEQHTQGQLPSLNIRFYEYLSHKDLHSQVTLSIDDLIKDFVDTHLKKNIKAIFELVGVETFVIRAQL